MFKDIQNTDEAIEPCLPLKYLVYPKRSFHMSDFILFFCPLLSISLTKRRRLHYEQEVVVGMFCAMM